MPSLPSWSATAPAGRILLAISAALGLLCTGAVSVALRTPPAVHRREVAALAPAAPALDAAGCPDLGRCRLTGELPAPMLAAIRRSFPGGTVQWQSSAVDPVTTRTYLARAAVTPGPDATLLVTARCVPGSTARDAPGRSTSAQQRSDLAGNQVALAVRILQQVPGDPGCALTLELTAPGQGSQYQAGLTALAHDPGAQVHRDRP